jgi:hypothetical protein
MRDDERAATRICRLNFFKTGDYSLPGVIGIFTSWQGMGNWVALEGDKSFGERSLYLDIGQPFSLAEVDFPESGIDTGN